MGFTVETEGSEALGLVNWEGAMPVGKSELSVTKGASETSDGCTLGLLEGIEDSIVIGDGRELQYSVGNGETDGLFAAAGFPNSFGGSLVGIVGAVVVGLSVEGVSVEGTAGFLLADAGFPNSDGCKFGPTEGTSVILGLSKVAGFSNCSDGSALGTRDSSSPDDGLLAEAGFSNSSGGRLMGIVGAGLSVGPSNIDGLYEEGSKGL